MNTRKEIREKIQQLRLSIAEQSKELRELQIQDMLLSDSEQWYTEDEEVLSYERRRDGSIMSKVQVGRIHWVEKFEEEKTDIQRSKIVRVNGDWVD